MAGRVVLAIILGLATTFGIFFLMQALIDTGRGALTEETQAYAVDFVRVPEPEEVRTKDRKPERPPEPEEPPPEPELPDQQMSRAEGQELDMGGGFSVHADISVDTGISGGSGDGEYLPIVKVAPVYPYRAQSRGIEGWVLVEFTVSTAGAVEDVQVVEADPAGIFEDAAVEAARKFKYKPRVVNGQPVAVTGVRNLIRFELEGERGR